MSMFSLLSPWSPSNHISAVLPLSVIFYLSYPCTDDLTALDQQSESRLHRWSVSKLDPLLEQLKPQQWGATERGLQCAMASYVILSWTLFYSTHFIPDYFPDPSDSSSCFSLLIWSSERTAITTSYLQLFFSFVTLATQSCHQLLGVGCPVSICKLLFIETMVGTSFLLWVYNTLSVRKGYNYELFPLWVSRILAEEICFLLL